jgi:hypothetical protein
MPIVKKDPQDTVIVEENTPVDTGRTAPATEAVKQDRPEPKADVNAVPQSYVWLANGVVLRVNDKDLPGASGASNQFGHWQTGNSVFEIVGVYPVESVVEES